MVALFYRLKVRHAAVRAVLAAADLSSYDKIVQSAVNWLLSQEGYRSQFSSR